MTEWKRSNNSKNSNNSNKKEGFGSKDKSKSKDDMHTRIILEKLRSISAKKKHENFANINPLRNVYEKEDGGSGVPSRGGSRGGKKVREGMDEGIFKNQSNLRLDDDDYDGHDNVDDDEEEAVINDMFKNLMGNISSGLKELFDRIELMFYYVAIFIYLVFSGGDMSRLNWFETQEQEVGAGVNSMDIPNPDIGGVGGIGGVKQDEGFDIGGIKKGEGDFDEEELEKKKKTGEKINKANESIPDKTPGVSASASFATVNEKDWRSRFNEKEVEDIELIYSYISWGECISLAILFTYGLYFYMFYTETDEHILNGNVKSARPSFCSWRWLVPFFSFSYKDFEDFYRESVDQEVDEEASILRKFSTSCFSWFLAVSYIIFQDSVYAIAVINEILMYWIPDYTKSLQDKLGFSNSLIFFVLALGVSLFLYSFGGQIKALILEGMFGFDFKNVGLLGAIILFLTIAPQFSKYASSIWNIDQMNVVPNEPIQVEGRLVGGSIFGKKEETEEEKEERIKNKIILPSLKYTNGTSIIDTYGYLLVNTIEKHAFPYPVSPTFSLIGKHIYNFFRFIFGLLISQILLPIYLVIYLIVFFLINPIMTLGGHFMQIIKNINTHKELSKDEYYNIFYVNDEGKNKTIDAAEISRVIDKDYGEGWMWYLNVFGEFLNNIIKTVFGPVFILMFLVLLTYFRSDLAENGNNSKLQNTLGPALLGMIALAAFMYLYQLYKSVKEEGGRISRFLREFLGIIVATNDASKTSKASKASKTSNSDEDMKGGNTNDKQDATMKDLIRAFKEAKSNVNKYSPDRWDNVLKQFKENFNSKSKYNDVNFESKVNVEGKDSTEKSIQNMTIDHFRQGLYRYFTAKYHDYIPLRSMYKSAGKDHPINQTFASRSCAPHTQMNEEK